MEGARAARAALLPQDGAKLAHEVGALGAPLALLVSVVAARPVRVGACPRFRDAHQRLACSDGLCDWVICDGIWRLNERLVASQSAGRC